MRANPNPAARHGFAPLRSSCAAAPVPSTACRARRARRACRRTCRVATSSLDRSCGRRQSRRVPVLMFSSRRRRGASASDGHGWSMQRWSVRAGDERPHAVGLHRLTDHHRGAAAATALRRRLCTALYHLVPGLVPPAPPCATLRRRFGPLTSARQLRSPSLPAAGAAQRPLLARLQCDAMQPAGWLSDHLRKRRVFVFGSCAAMGVGSVLMVSAARSRLFSAPRLFATCPTCDRVIAACDATPIVRAAVWQVARQDFLWCTAVAMFFGMSYEPTHTPLSTAAYPQYPRGTAR